MPAHTLIAAVPDDLARWLDAEELAGAEFGQPGYPELRRAWRSSDEPSPEFFADLAGWLQARPELNAEAQRAYERLLAVEPFEDGRIPGWYPEPWAQVLLSMPWDGRLAQAILDADAYCLDLTP